MKLIKLELVFLVMLFISNVGLSYVESPRNCLKEKSVHCYFGTTNNNKSHDKKSHIEISGNQIVFGPSTIMQMTYDGLHFVEGLFLVKVKEDFQLSVSNLKFDLGVGNYIFFKENEKYFLKTLDGIARVSDDLKSIQVTEGFQLELTSNIKGRYEIASISVIDRDKHLIQYGKYFAVNKIDYKNYVREFKKKYENYKNWGQELQDKVIQRYVAEENEERERKKKLQLIKEQKLKKLKELYFSKVFEK